MSAIIENPTPPKRALLDAIKMLGTASVEELSSRSQLAPTTVRQHLEDLLRGNLVVREPHRRGRGRPSYRYALSEAAHALYPSRDGELLRSLVEHLVRSGDKNTLDEFFRAFGEARADAFAQRLRAAGDDSLHTRIETLRAMLADEGFMPDIAIAADGSVTVRECNCPYRDTVRATLIPCGLEARFIESALSLKLRRVAFIPQGSPACTYESVAPGQADG